MSSRGTTETPGDDEEDDYMSPEVLEAMAKLEQAQKKGRMQTPTETKRQRSVRHFFFFFSSFFKKAEGSHRVHSREKTQEGQNRVLSNKEKREKEEERRQEGLSKAIPKENKGFQLLQRMGYKEGAGLGAKESGIIEPIAAVPRSGLGSFTPRLAFRGFSWLFMAFHGFLVLHCLGWHCRASWSWKRGGNAGAEAAEGGGGPGGGEKADKGPGDGGT